MIKQQNMKKSIASGSRETYQNLSLYNFEDFNLLYLQKLKKKSPLFGLGSDVDNIYLR